MKKIISTLVLLVILTSQVFANDQFWQYIKNNNLQDARDFALESAENDEIYYLYLSVIYNLLGDLNRSNIYRFNYYKNPNNDKELTDIASDIYTVHRSSYVLSFLGIMLWENNFKNHAKKYLRESVEIDDTNPFGNNYFSMIFYNRKNDQYLGYALKAIEIKPDYSEAYNNAAVAYMGLGNKKEAINTLKSCIENCPVPHINTYHNLLNLVGNDGISIKSRRDSFTIEGNSALEEQDIIFVYDLLSNYTDKYRQMVEVLIDRADYNEAYELLELAKNKNILISNNYYMAVLSYLNNRDQDFFSYTSKISENDVIGYQDLYQLANIFYELQDWDNAEKFYNMALNKLDKIDSLYGMRINANLGTTLMRKGDTESGLTYLLESLSFNPYDEIALTNIGYFYKQSGELEKSKIYLNKALEYATEERTKAQILDILNE